MSWTKNWHLYQTAAEKQCVKFWWFHLKLKCYGLILMVIYKFCHTHIRTHIHRTKTKQSLLSQYLREKTVVWKNLNIWHWLKHVCIRFERIGSTEMPHLHIPPYSFIQKLAVLMKPSHGKVGPKGDRWSSISLSRLNTATYTTSYNWNLCLPVTLAHWKGSSSTWAITQKSN